MWRRGSSSPRRREENKSKPSQIQETRAYFHLGEELVGFSGAMRDGERRHSERSLIKYIHAESRWSQ